MSQRKRVEALTPYLKDGETPAECVARNRADVDSALSLLAKEKLRAESAEQRLEAAERELLHWKTCSLCGEVMTAPGHCDSAESEKAKGLEQMSDDLLDRAEAAEATIARLRELAKEATNGWACYAKRKIEHDDIARIHREIDALGGKSDA